MHTATELYYFNQNNNKLVVMTREEHVELGNCETWETQAKDLP